MDPAAPLGAQTAVGGGGTLSDKRGSGSSASSSSTGGATGGKKTATSPLKNAISPTFRLHGRHITSPSGVRSHNADGSAWKPRTPGKAPNPKDAAKTATGSFFGCAAGGPSSGSTFGQTQYGLGGLPSSSSNGGKATAANSAIREASSNMNTSSSSSSMVSGLDDERFNFLLHHGVVKAIEGQDRVIFAELPNLPLIVYRSPIERAYSPERFNLDRRKLTVCPLLEGEEKLRLLNFQKNQIAKIENLVSLPSLIFLDLYGNLIEVIENLQPVAATLKVLMLGKNRVRAGVPHLAVLTRLDVVDLHANQLEQVPLHENAPLRVLNLASNRFESQFTLPHLLPNLLELNLRRNRIEHLGRLDQVAPALQRLYVSHNELKNLKAVACVTKMPKLQDLSLDNNPLYSGGEEAGVRKDLVLRCASSLKTLDEKPLSEEEKKWREDKAIAEQEQQSTAISGVQVKRGGEVPQGWASNSTAADLDVEQRRRQLDQHMGAGRRRSRPESSTPAAATTESDMLLQDLMSPTKSSAPIKPFLDLSPSKAATDPLTSAVAEQQRRGQEQVGGSSSSSSSSRNSSATSRVDPREILAKIDFAATATSSASADKPALADIPGLAGVPSRVPMDDGSVRRQDLRGEENQNFNARPRPPPQRQSEVDGCSDSASASGVSAVSDSDVPGEHPPGAAGENPSAQQQHAAPEEVEKKKGWAQLLHEGETTQDEPADDGPNQSTTEPESASAAPTADEQENVIEDADIPPDEIGQPARPAKITDAVVQGEAAEQSVSVVAGGVQTAARPGGSPTGSPPAGGPDAKNKKSSPEDDFVDNTSSTSSSSGIRQNQKHQNVLASGAAVMTATTSAPVASTPVLVSTKMASAAASIVAGSGSAATTRPSTTASHAHHQQNGKPSTTTSSSKKQTPSRVDVLNDIRQQWLDAAANNRVASTRYGYVKREEAFELFIYGRGLDAIDKQEYQAVVSSIHFLFLGVTSVLKCVDKLRTRFQTLDSLSFARNQITALDQLRPLRSLNLRSLSVFHNPINDSFSPSSLRMHVLHLLPTLQKFNLRPATGHEAAEVQRVFHGCTATVAAIDQKMRPQEKQATKLLVEDLVAKAVTGDELVRELDGNFDETVKEVVADAWDEAMEYV